MKALLSKELKFVFCSSAGAFFAVVFLLITGGMLWAFSGTYNIIDNGYANLDNFFSLSPILFAVLIPALTMRLFAEEKKNKTIDILRTRPVSVLSIYFSKYIATLVFVIVTLLPTIVYVYSLYQLANPVGNIDISSIIASYISLILIVCVFISIGLFGSSVTNNQVVAFIISVFLCLFIYYGFTLFTSFFLTGKIQIWVSSIGLYYHYQLMQRGVIELKNIICIANYLLIFILLSFYIHESRKLTVLFSLIIILLVMNVISLFIPESRLDFTNDKRYTLNNYSKNILKDITAEKPLQIRLYLDGELNYGFQHLKNATIDLLSDFNRYASGNINIISVNPYIGNETSDIVFDRMYEKGMVGIMLNEVDREGKTSRKMIYPYAEVSNGSDTLVVSLLKNIDGNTADENLNASIESLEFEFIDAIRLLGQQEIRSIAFIEGHNELPRTYVYDAETLFSKYYTVDRGQIGNQIGVLDNYAAIIIAGPLSEYSLSEKYIIDQYIMSGGKVLWLLDGVYYSHEELAAIGRSASMKNELNLDDMLFTYGVRINPDLIQDQQCLSTYVLTEDGAGTKSVLIPSYFQPLLIPSSDHPITKNIRDVKGGFVSSISIVNNSPSITKNILLTSSGASHLLNVPELIDFDIERIQNIPDYFNQSYVPVAISLEGTFPSSFTNRPIPDSIDNINRKPLWKSKPTKMVVISSSDIISNEIQGIGEDSRITPMGYDRVSKQQYGNRDFIINAMNWMIDDVDLMSLRTKKQQLYSLNKREALENKNKYAIQNIGFPVLFILIVMGSVYIYRKRKYER